MSAIDNYSKIYVNKDQPLGGQILQFLYQQEGVPFTLDEIRRELDMSREQVSVVNDELDRLAREEAIKKKTLDVYEEYEMDVYWARCDS